MVRWLLWGALFAGVAHGLEFVYFRMSDPNAWGTRWYLTVPAVVGFYSVLVLAAALLLYPLWWSWRHVAAERWPWIERSAAARFTGLTIVSLVLPIGVAGFFKLIGVPMSADPFLLAPVGLPWVPLYVVVWAPVFWCGLVLPRLLVPSLRGPLTPRVARAR